MSIITIDKRTIPVTARNGRIYTTTGTVSTSTSSSSVGGSNVGTVTGVTAGNGMTQTGTATLNPVLNVVSAAGTAGTVGTLTVTADAVGVSLGSTSTTAAAGNHLHSGVYESVLGNPSVSGYILSSTAAGVRSWIAPTAGSETLATVTARGACTALGIQTGNISIKDCLSLSAYATCNTINTMTPLYVNYNGVNKILINSGTTFLTDVKIEKTAATLILSSATQTTEKIIFSDNGATELEIGHDGVNLDETYINANKPLSIKYSGVEKMSIASGVNVTALSIGAVNIYSPLYFILESDVTTTSTALVDITGFYINNLAPAGVYEFEANLLVATTADANGTAYGLGTTTGAIATGTISGSRTSSTTYQKVIDNATEASGFLLTGSQTGAVLIKGIFNNTSSSFSIKHRKATSGTSTIKAKSYLKLTRIS